MTTPIKFSVEPLNNGAKLGVITLSSPKTLNALSLEMIDPMTAQLQSWAADPEIIVILLQGEGQKAFCAGGDIVQLYQSMCDNPTGPNAYAEAFFSREYQLDYLLHTYTKPIICWGDGIVMGGGLGLLSGCSHRVVTENTRMAMPEITIGLFPDVGGTWFLNRMPGNSGLFLGLTGASINASDAIFTGLADYFLASSSKESLRPTLQSIPWTTDAQSNRQILTQALTKLSDAETKEWPPAQVEPHMAIINDLVKPDNLSSTVQAITSFSTEDKWLNRGIASLQHGCPVTAHLVYAQLHRGCGMALNDVFRMELSMAMNCCTRGDFQEGVRALLIDKDQQPAWRFQKIEQVPEDWIESHFDYKWPGDQHPLSDI
ncbi:MAG: enoyl-CoA hydratase/isomerase family protein [Hahellaceae bacterium]|nr:enoyl-CoA hydratase/isomerase family protein [Hahellaceae bacterium]MCP5210664.1 enoyl-CoA hydratase/isomerase family protein [Hahellaceae bacterium]